MPKYVQILGKVSAHSGTSKYISLRVTQPDENLVNPPCQFQDPFFNKGEMVDVSVRLVMVSEYHELGVYNPTSAEIFLCHFRHELVGEPGCVIRVETQ